MSSPRRYDPDPPEWDCGPDAEVHRLGRTGQLKIEGRWWQISEALPHEPVRLLRLGDRILVYHGASLIRELDLCAQRSTAVDRWAQPTNCKGCPGNDV